MLSQIALAQAVQRKFKEAHATLDIAEAQLTPTYDLARVRILLERGRVFQQADNITEARNYFEQSYALSEKNKFDFHTLNAAHMIAIVAEKAAEKIAWNQCAITMAATTSDERARLWLGSLYHNLGQNYVEAEQFEKALSAFQKALKYREKEGYVPNIRVATWAVARALRSLDRLDEAVAMQLALLKEYDVITMSGTFDMPVEMFTLTRGLVYEELAELYHAQQCSAEAEVYASLAYDALSRDEMFKKISSERLKRLEQLRICLHIGNCDGS